MRYLYGEPSGFFRPLKPEDVILDILWTINDTTLPGHEHL